MPDLEVSAARPTLRRAIDSSRLPVKRSPRKRSTDGMTPRYALRHKIPGRHYVWGYVGDADGMAQYRASRYRTEKWDFKLRGNKPILDDEGLPQSKGVCPLGAFPEIEDQGKTIKVGDHILLSCSAERYAEIVKYGHDGDTGQDGADEIEERLIKHTKGKDALRGLKGITRGHHVDIEEYHEHGAEHGLTTLEDRL